MPDLKRYIYVRMARTALYVMYIYRSVKHALKRLPHNRKSIVFYLENDTLYRDDMGRYPYVLLNKFSQSGYNVYFYKNVDTFKKYLELGKYGRFIYSIPNLKVISKIPAQLSVPETQFAFDTINKPLLEQKWKKLIYVNMCRPTLCQTGEAIWIPYSFHPIAYKNGIDTTIQKLRNNSRKLKIIFAGNSVASGYSVKKLKDWYNKLTRHEGIKAVLEINDKVKTVENSDQFCKMINEGSYINECRLLRTDRATRLNVKGYWDIISKSDFFLALSGTDYPMCHNVIESMAVGTIPIMGYGEWFFPPLKHGENAIIYSDAEDLKAKVRDVLNINERAIQKMRNNVIDYYEKYLTSESFVSKVEANQDKVITIMLHPHLVCTPQEDEAGKQFMQELTKQVKGATNRSKNFRKAESNV